jgi:hypothetical protein
MTINDWQARGWRFHQFVAERIPKASFNIMIGVGKRRQTIFRLMVDEAYLRTMDWPATFEGTPVVSELRVPEVAFSA